MSEATVGSTDRRGFLRKGLVAGAGLAAVAGMPGSALARTMRPASALTAGDVAAAHAAGAADADVQLAVLIAAAFSMYNRIVEGFRARTPPTADAYRGRAVEIAANGYSDPRVISVPG